MYSEQNMDRDHIFHERVNILKNDGYRGFIITSEKNKGHEIEVTATNLQGKILSAGGETKEEAFKKIIDLIDMAIDDHFA
jgi:hypothetical protein